MNIASVLEQEAHRSRARAAIIERDRSISFDELNAAVASAAAELAHAGVQPGMRVLLFSRMSIALYTAMIALFRLRATAVFVDPAIGRERLERCVRRVQPGALVAMPRAHLLRITSAAIRAIPIKASIGGRVPGAVTVARRLRSTGRAIEACDPDTPAIITFTSGSTGEPKAAVRTHGFLLAQHRALAEALTLAPGEIDLCTLPIFLLANLGSGVTSVIPDADLRAVGSIDPLPVAAQIRERKPVRTVASPAFLARLIGHTGKSGGPFASFQRIFTGGAPVFPAFLDALAAAAPAASIVSVYGSTEAEPIAKVECRQITDADRQAMSAGAGLLAGCPVTSVQLRVIPDRWGQPLGPFGPDEIERQALAPGAAGEIIVSGDHVLAGYLDGAGDEETKIKAAGRVWHRTGDAGYLDSHGRLWLLGRCAAKVSDDRGIIYPFAVEAAASGIQAVARSAFVMLRGRRVLVAEVGGNQASVRTTLLERLTWAHLDDVKIVRQIPVDRRHNAKVEYPALMRMLERP